MTELLLPTPSTNHARARSRRCASCTANGIALLLFALSATPVVGQAFPPRNGNETLPAPAGAMVANDAPREGFVKLNLEGNIKLRALIDLLEERQNWNFLYDSKIGEREINVKAPNEIPTEALPALLSSILKMNNLALVDADIPGWKQIIDAAGMMGHVLPGDPQQVLDREGAATPVTRAFVIKNVQVADVTALIKPFLTKQGGSNTVTAGKTLIITDFASKILTVERLIKLLDQPAGEAKYQVYTVKNTTSGELAKLVQTMLSGKANSDEETQATGVGFTATAQRAVGIFDEPRTNQIVVVGTQTQVSKALELLMRFDVSIGLKTIVYRLQHVKAERLDKIMTGFISPQDTDRAYQSTVDEVGNLLIVRTTAENHSRIDELKKQIDVPVRSEESPIRFYKLKNANATDVLYTLLALQEVAGSNGALGTGSSLGSGGVQGAGGTTAGAANPNGANPLSINITPGAQTQGFSPFASFGGGLGLGGIGGGQFGAGGLGRNQSFGLPLSPQQNGVGSFGNIQQFGQDRRSAVLAPQLATGGVASLPGGARVSADITTNSLVIVARTEIQELYKRLIESLDIRRPQVLIEAKIVAVDTSGNFNLGVEFSGGDRTGSKRLFSFTSFGLSEVDSTTGALGISPSLGFNGALVDPDVADIVVKALSSHSRVNVLSSPRILVNDNATGELESVTSVPFQSVNASDTVATTSLGGDQQAGTTITVTPRIKEDNHLQIEFSLEFSTFAEGGSAALPPPRQIDRVGSDVTIPNGHTIIVGGLKRSDETNGRTGIPFAESIPILRELTSLTTKSNSTTSFFVFLRPVILRDAQFEDLKLLSEISAQDAGLPPEYPTSQPIMIE